MADSNGFVVVWPQGTFSLAGYSNSNPSWNAGRCCGSAANTNSGANISDVGFLRTLVTTTRSTYNTTIDPSRVYFAGHSNGCMMAQRMAVAASDLVAAVGCHSGWLMTGSTGSATPSAPTGYVPRSVMVVTGLSDRVVPYAQSNYWPGGLHNMQMWASTEL